MHRHQLFTDFLGLAVDAQPDLVWLGAVHAVEDAVERCRAFVPDVVIVELDVENGGGLEPMSELLDVLPGLHVVLLVAVATDSLLQRAMMAGASALLPEDGSLEVKSLMVV
ncbi:hypothetical protein KMZ30_19475 [Phycicoccus sp. KQZ13P-1]|uniref:hypothetical protein n=1 Tax=Phycicoccus mangrovi TaxID=2840470 RepID=UPI001BFFF69F|nr:hypothetical protein [Phycicoccus mangrovi]MBT9257755.1 hypothetical protein [Phycicoccus mangrovi]